ncbi:MAG: ABC transporter substrate-binding protein [Clostridiales bacterium]|nr:ABC transporter substrate-binding protein [Clostridiales bacterium]
MVAGILLLVIHMQRSKRMRATSQAYIEAALAGQTAETEELVESYFSVVSGSESMLRGEIQEKINSLLDQYNRGELEYETVCESVDALSYSGLESFIEEKTAYLETLYTSKACYAAGMEAVDQSDYVEATIQLSSVVQEDTLYSDAQASLESCSDELIEDLYARIDSALDESDDSQVYSYLTIGTTYSDSSSFDEMTAAMDDCGNPFVYLIAEQIYANIKTIQKNEDHPRKKCKNLVVYQLSNRTYLLTAHFNAKKNADVYYMVTTDGVVAIDEVAFQTYWGGAGADAQVLTIEWDTSLKKAEKQSLLREKMLQFGPSAGDTSDVSTKEDDDGLSYQPSGIEKALSALVSITVMIGIILLLLGVFFEEELAGAGVICIVGAFIIVGIAAVFGLEISFEDGQTDTDTDTNNVQVQVQEEETLWPSDALEYDGHRYAIYDLEEESLDSWDAVEAFCEEMGGHLAVIDSQEENDALYQYVLDSGLTLAFFGYSDQDEEGNWQWVAGDSSYTNWLEGQPNNGAANSNGSAENYAEFSKDAADGTWNDAPFGANTYHFICEWDCDTSEDAADVTVSDSVTDSDVATLNISLASEPDYLDPTLVYTVDGSCLAVNSFEGLMTYSADGELVEGCAESYTASEDGLTYTFTLREGLKWSNGADLDASDFEYAWRRAADVETAADYQYLYEILADCQYDEDGRFVGLGESSVVASEDGSTLTVTLASPCAYFLELCAFPTFFPVYQETVEANNPEGITPGGWALDAGDSFVCNGAYVLQSWNHDSDMTYVKNEYYRSADSITIETLNFTLSSDDTAIYAAYQSGELDFIDAIPADELTGLLESSDPELYIVDELGTAYVTLNYNSDLWDELGLGEDEAAVFRHALCLLVDRQSIAENITQAGQELATTFVPSAASDGNGGLFEDGVAYYSVDDYDANVEEAKALLESIGFAFDENGMLTADVSFSYLVNHTAANISIAEEIQADFASVGINMVIDQEEWNVFVETRKEGGYDMARGAWIMDYNDPINMLEMWTTDSGNNDCQFGRDSSKSLDWSVYDDLITQIRSTADTAERVTLMREAEDMLMETWCVLPLYYYNDPYMVKNNVSGVLATVSGTKYFQYATKTAE